MKVRQRRVVGSILKVPLGDGWHSYAWVLPEVDFVLFDLRTASDVLAVEVVTRPIAFRVAVNGSAYLDGRWLRVGRVAPPETLLAPVAKFIRDPIGGAFSIYLAGVIRPAERVECVGLERCAVWAPEHVEDRLRSHYSGIPCQWTLSLQPEGIAPNRAG